MELASDLHTAECSPMVSAWRLLVVAMIGVVTVVATYATGMPGAGLFLVVAGLAGLGTALLAPGWAGYLVLLASVAATCLAAVSLGSYGGLIVLVIASLWLPASIGWLVGYVVHHVRLRGLRQSVHDVRVILASLTAVGLIGVVALVAMSFATDPP
ncbi:MAG TPA: hypothetical protein VFY23_01150 [Candidatus Limnocylindrales bacterium]|nr:hypothetical protein [Candidatus Limnocylindrales bacterium]